MSTSAATSRTATPATSGRRRPPSRFRTRGRKLIGTKECGLVEYRFAPDSFEVYHVRAPGQIDIDLDDVLKAM